MNKINIYKTPQAVAQAAADYIFTQINTCVDKNGQCHVVLPGGSTPTLCLKLLAEKPLPWGNIHWYLGDERCYPVGHNERNDSMISDNLFSQQEAAINFHPIPAELGPEQGARKYAATIDEVLSETGGEMNIAILGMGEDGHTASLFPGNIALQNPRSAVPVYDSPKAPDERVSIGLGILKHADQRIVITSGENKREALVKLKAGAKLPVAMIDPDTWFIDNAAMPGS